MLIATRKLNGDTPAELLVEADFSTAEGCTMAATLVAGASQADGEKPTVVIVHGAFADCSDWAKVVPILQAEGVGVTVMQNPLTSLAAAAQRALNNQPGNVVLVGHSWGGSIISQADDHEKVGSLRRRVRP